MKLIYVIILVLTGGMFSACKKDKNEAGSVTITFIEPSVNDTIPSWNQIHMEGTITADGQMSGYAVSAINASTHEVLFTTSYNVKSGAYNFHEHWINSLYDTTIVTVRVEALKNANGDKEVNERNVVCLP